MGKLEENKETKEERLAKSRQKRENVAKEMLDKYPSLEIVRHDYGIDVISYIPLYHNGITTRRVSRPIYEKTFKVEGYTTRTEAIEAITPIVGSAKKKFKEIVNAFLRLNSTHECRISTWSEECCAKLCVEFKMEKFDFFFDIPED